VRILVVDPGPAFSVQDVSNGYVEAFENLGHDVRRFAFGDVMTYHHRALVSFTETDKNTADHEGARLAGLDLRGACFDLWPDLVVIVSGFFVPPDCYDIIRSRGIKVCVILTESPYEDDAQKLIAARADCAVVNDPTNLDLYPNGIYLPHAYRPMHLLGKPKDDFRSEFCFVGTGYPSRIEFLESCDFDGIDVALAGNWQDLTDDSPIAKFVAHDRKWCFENSDTIDFYASTVASVNLYRTEAQRPELSVGWAMGPREIELAASGTFFLTEARGENREVLPMVPTFDGPEDFTEKLRWWLAHSVNRNAVVRQARAAVADYTFENNALRLLEHAGF
jgi:spore maturation protein CgeB